MIALAGLAGGAPWAKQGDVDEVSAREGSLEQSGELRATQPVDRHKAPIAAPNPLPAGPEEKPVEMPAPAPPPVAQGVPAEILALDTNMPARVTDLLACRMEIATDRRVRLQAVAAGTVLMRWTVQPGGGVTDAEVVSERATDPDMLSCVRRKMESWVFIRAPGGEPMAVQQTLKFD